MSGARYVLHLPYPKPPLNANQRLHHMAVYRLRKKIASVTFTLAHHHRLPKGLQRVEIVLHYRPSSRRPRDVDNLYPTLKPAIDGLKAYGLVPDDNSLHVGAHCVIDPVERGMPPALYLVITDLSPQAA